MKLYIYEHCPYCIRVRMILGLKNISCELIYLQDDDVKTPTQMSGKKMVPILEIKEKKYLPESLDIVSYLDKIDGNPLLQEKTNREDLEILLKKYHSPLKELFFSYAAEANFPELKTTSAKANFMKRFMAKFPYEHFSQIKERDKKNKLELKSFLKEIASSIYSPDSISNNKIGYDDIIYFPVLHGLTVIPDLEWDPISKNYLWTIMDKTKLKPFIQE